MPKINNHARILILSSLGAAVVISVVTFSYVLYNKVITSQHADYDKSKLAHVPEISTVSPTVSSSPTVTNKPTSTPKVSSIPARASLTIEQIKARIINFLISKHIISSASDINSITIQSYNFSNSCLGVTPPPGIMCDMVITPGYKADIITNVKHLVLHLNKSASIIKIAKQENIMGQVNEPTSKPTSKEAVKITPTQTNTPIKTAPVVSTTEPSKAPEPTSTITSTLTNIIRPSKPVQGTPIGTPVTTKDSNNNGEKSDNLKPPEAMEFQTQEKDGQVNSEKSNSVSSISLIQIIVNLWHRFLKILR